MRLFCSILLISLIFIIGFSQTKVPDFSKLYEIGNFYYNTKEPNDETDLKAINNFEKFINASPLNKQTAEKIQDAHKKVGILHQTYSRLKESLINYQKSIIIGKQYSLTDSVLFESFMYSGMIKYYHNQFDSCYYYLNKAEKIFNRFPKVDKSESLFNTFGVLFYESGNYLQSLNYYEKAQNIIQKKGDSFEDFAVKSNIATSLRQIGKPKEALKVYETILDKNPNEDKILINIAATYLDLNQADNALALLLRVKKDDIPANQIILENRLGQVFFQKKNYALAAVHLQKSISIHQKNQKKGDSNKIAELGNTYKLLGDISVFGNKLGEALYFFQKAIFNLNSSSAEDNIYTKQTNFSSNINNLLLLNTIIAKADCFKKMYVKVNKSRHYFNKSVEDHEAAFQLINFLLKQYDNEAARQFLAEKYNSFFDSYFKLLIEGHQIFSDSKLLEAAFLLSERSKSCILGINLNENKFKNQQIIPDSILIQERLLKAAKSKFMIDQNFNTLPDSTKKLELIDLEVKLSRLQTLINEFELNQIKASNWRIEDLKKQYITSKRGILSIYKANETYHLFLLNKTGLHFKNLGNAKEIDFLVNFLNDKIAGNLSGKTFSGKPQCQLLYFKLLKPIENELSKLDELIIIPHFETVRLPFEILLDENEEYILKKWKFSYEYSADILLSTIKNKELEMNKMLIYAPFSNEKLNNFLPASLKEIETLRGKKILDKTATKQSFIANSGGASIIHLSTHAQVDNLIPEKSYISFYPNANDTVNTRLYSEEIKLLNLHNAELLFLSACETSAGKQTKNEGVMSLTRAFSLAGCTNIITSLWMAEDEATAYISQHFYGHLKAGNSIVESLQKAKLDLLDDPTMAQYHSPTYWGHLILVGFPEESTKWTNIIIFAALLLVCLIGFIRTWPTKTKHNS